MALVVVGCLVPGLVCAATRYLNPASGNDGNPGTLASPWKTLDKAASSANAGDTVNVLAGTYTRAQYTLSGDYFVWNTSYHRGVAGSPITIQANPGDTVVFDGQNQSYWVYFDAHVNTAFYVVIKNLTFQNYTGVAIGIFGDGAQAQFVTVQGSTFQNFGVAGSSPVSTSESDHVLLLHNTLTHIGDPAFGGFTDPAGEHFVYIAHGTQYMVIDGNYMEGNSGCGLHFYGGDFGFTTRNTITRKNTVVNAHCTGLILASTNYLNTYIYHNTFYQEPVPFPVLYSDAVQWIIGSHLSASLNNTVIKNNIGYGYAQTAIALSDDNTRFNGSLIFDYNLWNNLADSSLIYSWNNTSYTQAGFKLAYPGYEAHSLQTNPLFVNATTRDFTLQSTSPAINAGTVLTTAVGSGSGTTLTVADAGYFMDGFGMVPGDTIQVGSQVAMITSINYGTNTLTLQSPLTWTNGQGVALPYAGTAPDMGAFESGSGPAPLGQGMPPYITWDAPVLTGGFTLTGFQVQACEVIPNCTQTCAPVNVSGGILDPIIFHFVDTTVAPGHSYVYQVLALALDSSGSAVQSPATSPLCLKARFPGPHSPLGDSRVR